MIYRKLLFVTLISCSVFNTSASSGKKIRVGVLDFPPYYIVRPQSVNGILPKMINKILKEAKTNYELTAYPPARLYNNIVNGSVNLYLGSKNSPIIEDHIFSSKEVFDTVELRVYGIGNIKLPTKKEDLKNNIFIGIRGYQYGGLITYLNNPKNKIKIYLASSHETAFKMLEEKRADFLLEYKHPAEKYLLKNSIKNIKYNILDTIPLQFIVSKKTPNGQKLLKRVVKAYKKLRKAGKLYLKP